MKFNTIEIADAAGISHSNCSNRIKALGYSPCGKDLYNHCVSIWEFPSLEFIVNALIEHQSKTLISFKTIAKKYYF